MWMARCRFHLCPRTRHVVLLLALRNCRCCYAMQFSKLSRWTTYFCIVYVPALAMMSTVSMFVKVSSTVPHTRSQYSFRYQITLQICLHPPCRCAVSVARGIGRRVLTLLPGHDTTDPTAFVIWLFEQSFCSYLLCADFSACVDLPPPYEMPRPRPWSQHSNEVAAF